MQNILYEYETNDKFFQFSENNFQKEEQMKIEHFHPHYEIFYLEKGCCDYFIKGNLYNIMSGDIVLIDKHLLHKTLYSESVNSHRYLLSFNNQFIQTNFTKDKTWLLSLFEFDSPIIRLEASKKSELEHIIIQIYTLCKIKSIGYKLYIETLFMQLLLLMHNSINEHTKIAPKKPSETEQKILDIAAFIDRNYDQPLNLTILSKKFYISPHYLSHRFKEVTGFTLSDYIHYIRIKKSQELLTQSSLKIIDISEKCGFGSVSQFRRVFNKNCGTSPLNYRKIYQAKRS